MFSFSDKKVKTPFDRIEQRGFVVILAFYEKLIFKQYLNAV